MNEKEFKEKLIVFLIELSKPKKYDVGFVQGNKIINDGLVILGMNATDILGFSKPANERRIRRTKGVQAWFKHMYENGWRYAGTFEQEGLLNNGFVIMERELPNRVLDAIKEELNTLLKEGEIPQIVKDHNYFRELNSDASIPLPHTFKAKLEEEIPIGTRVDIIPQKEGLPIVQIPKAVKEPRDGFESEVNDFIIGSKKEMKTAEEIFFDETGKRAIWKGKETKAFKEWQKNVMSNE